MKKPQVTCVMLANGRPAMVQRAIRAFEFQTYEPRRLLIFDTSLEPTPVALSKTNERLVQVIMPDAAVVGRPIGGLRNQANSLADGSQIIAHWDSDDWSAPDRLERQVAILQKGEECTGYNQMLFWRDCDKCQKLRLGDDEEGVCVDGTAWMYRYPMPGWALGTSLCYWREVWHRNPFPEKTAMSDGSGEDTAFLKHVKCKSESGIRDCGRDDHPGPLMIAHVHGSNMTSKIDPDQREWTRVNEWDKRVLSIMEEA